jgi:hypothetical protein
MFVSLFASATPKQKAQFLKDLRASRVNDNRPCTHETSSDGSFGKRLKRLDKINSRRNKAVVKDDSVGRRRRNNNKVKLPPIKKGGDVCPKLKAERNSAKMLFEPGNGMWF